MPGVVNHAIEVIFQDYQNKFMVEIVTATPRKEEERDQRRAVVEVKAFFCSGVKASFRKTPGKKLLQVTGYF